MGGSLGGESGGGAPGAGKATSGVAGQAMPSLVGAERPEYTSCAMATRQTHAPSRGLAALVLAMLASARRRAWRDRRAA
jgi:hypothetical protein